MNQVAPRKWGVNLYTGNMLFVGHIAFIPFIKENGVILLILSLILLIIAVSQYLIIQKLRKKKEFLEEIKEDDSPLNSASLLKTLLGNVQDFVYVKDKESRFVAASLKLARVMGKKSPEELIGLRDHDFYPDELADDFRKVEIDIINTGKAIENRVEEGLDENGNKIWVSSSKYPVFDKNGKVVGVTGIGRDVTAIKEKEENLKSNSYKLTEANTLLEERQEEILQQQEEIKIQSEKFNEEKNQLLTLINSMPDRIYIKDRNSRFIIGNIHVTQIMGAKTPEEVIGKTDHDFYSKDLADAYFKDEQEIMENDIQIINKEERGLDLNKEEIIVSTTKVPVKDDDGNIIGIVGIGRDITNQKKVEAALKEKSEALQEANVLLEERQEEIQQQSEELKTQSENLMKINQELEKLSIVASKSGNVIIIMDGKGNIEWVNEEFERRYKMKMDEFVAKYGKSLLESSSYKEIDKAFSKMKETGKSVIYTARTNVNNEDFWSQTTITPIFNDKNEISKIVAIDSNITDLKEAEEQIESQRDELKKLNATKDKFFSIIAHDLKNPFHSIMGFSDLLTRSYDAIEEDKKKEFIKLINDSSTSAYGLLENLLNWARTQTNRIKYNPSRIDIAVIANEVFQMMSVNAENKNVSLELPSNFKEIYAFADYNMIYTVIRNLVSNALKFTESGGKVSIRTENMEKRLNVIIEDTGIGMSREDKNNLFRLDEFHTTTGTSGETGTGLGLIVCREFILIHGGDIHVESEEGKGSSFSFTLPLKGAS